MYAVIETGGKQYRVELGTQIQVDRLDVQPGETIQLERVLLVSDGDEAAIGRPLVEGARVSADVLGQDRGQKIVVFKYKPKARRRVKKGHRAELTTLRISDITHAGRSAAAEVAKAARARARAAAAAQKAAAQKAAADQVLASKLAAQAPQAETETPQAETETPQAERETPQAEKVAPKAARSSRKTAAKATAAVAAGSVETTPGPGTQSESPEPSPAEPAEPVASAAEPGQPAEPASHEKATDADSSPDSTKDE